MNTGKLKQTFERLAKSVTQFHDSENLEEAQSQPVPSMPTIRGGMLMDPKIVIARSQALHEITEQTEVDGVWSVTSIDDVVWSFIDHVLGVRPEKRKDAIRSEIDQVVKRFREDPSVWIVDLMIYGMHETCAGATFGRLTFLGEEVTKFEDSTRHPDFPKGIQIFGRLETVAIDEESAIGRAGAILDEHLMVLNALFSSDVPSWIQVSRDDRIRPFHSANRVGRSPDSIGPVRAYSHNRRIPLQRGEFDALLKRKMGARISQMFATPTEFNKRILCGYQFAGAGCVDPHPERSFLMLAIALESVILAKKTKSELTYQLASRVAHLIGKGLDGRKSVVVTVTDLYDRRSQIVHAGQYGVSRRQAATMYFYCMTALGMLVVSPAFSGFTTENELEEWFKDRMLDGPNHFNPESNLPD